MTKVLDAVFGIGIAVIVFIVALLGIKAFYPEPTYEKFCNNSYYSYPQPISDIYTCPDNITVSECKTIINPKEDFNSTEYKARDEEMMKCQTEFDTARKSYNKIFFIIASILGLIAIIVAFFMLNIMNLSAGVAFAGIVLICVAFARGWTDSDDTLKFVIGLVIAVVIIALALKLNKKFDEKKGPEKEKK